MQWKIIDVWNKKIEISQKDQKTVIITVYTVIILCLFGVGPS